MQILKPAHGERYRTVSRLTRSFDSRPHDCFGNRDSFLIWMQPVKLIMKGTLI